MTWVTLERSRSKWLAPIVGHHRRGTSENNDDDAGDEDYDYEDDDGDDDGDDDDDDDDDGNDDDDGPSTIARRLRIQAQTNHTVFSEYQQFQYIFRIFHGAFPEKTRDGN